MKTRNQKNTKTMKRYIFIFSLSVCFFVLFSTVVRAQSEDKIALTITPPLIKINMNPGEAWTSTIKVTNNSSTLMKVFPQAIDFKSGDDGGVEFIFPDKNTLEDSAAVKKFALSQWLKMNSETIDVAPSQSAEIPFAIELPLDAEPGGHYAAVVVGNKSAGEIKGSGIKISSMVASLILLNVAGDVSEGGRIRQFSSDKNFYEKPSVNFTLKFENTGNVHLQPRGEIEIFNMFGIEKGKIPINQGNSFGHVLPQSIRKWNFEYSDTDKITNMGRYKASLILSFGLTGKEAISQDIYFWVINFKIVGMILGSILLLIILIVFLIKRSIKKAVSRTARELSLTSPNATSIVVEPKNLPVKTEEKPALPPVVASERKSNVVDLKSMMKK
jgi:hypothetical protein